MVALSVRSRQAGADSPGRRPSNSTRPVPLPGYLHAPVCPEVAVGAACEGGAPGAQARL